MKKVITVLAGIIISASAFSQLSIGAQGIGNLSSASLNTSDLVNPVKKARMLQGAGLVADYTFCKNTSLRSGVNFLQQGVKVESNSGVNTLKFEATTSLDYLQVPVQIVYSVPLAGFRLFAGAGGYYSFGINGKTKLTTTTTLNNGNTQVTKEENDAFKKESDGGSGFKRSDYGAGILAGVQLPDRFYIHAGYQLSFANINSNDAGKYKNRSLQLTIGCFLWNSK
ncbi:outer membrane beta-barrel protein [Ferruginibacter sp.]